MRKIKKKFKNLYNGRPKKGPHYLNNTSCCVGDLLAAIYFYTKNEDQIKRLFFNSPFVKQRIKEISQEDKIKNLFFNSSLTREKIKEISIMGYFQDHLNFVIKVYKNNKRPFAYLRRTGR